MERPGRPPSPWLDNGVRHANHVPCERDRRRDTHDYASIINARRMSCGAIADRNAYEPDNNMKVLCADTRRSGALED